MDSGLLRGERKRPRARAVRGGTPARVRRARPVAAIRERLSELLRAGRSLGVAPCPRRGPGSFPRRRSGALRVAQARHLLGREPGRILPRRAPCPRAGADPGALGAAGYRHEGACPRDRARLCRGQPRAPLGDDGRRMRSSGVPGNPDLPDEGPARVSRLPGGRPRWMPGGRNHRERRPPAITGRARRRPPLRSRDGRPA